MTSLFLPAVSHSFFLLFLSILFPFRVFLFISLFHVFFFPFLFPFFPLSTALCNGCTRVVAWKRASRERRWKMERERRGNRSNSEREREKNDQANQIKQSRPLAAAAMTTTQPEAVAGRERRRGRTKKKGT